MDETLRNFVPSRDKGMVVLTLTFTKPARQPDAIYMTDVVKKEIIKVGIADDHDVFKRGLKMALSLYKDLQVVLNAVNGADLLEKLQTIRPDIILLDLRMPVMDGFTALPLIKQQYPEIKVIILSLNNEEVLMAQLMEMGASSFFSKNAEPAYMYQVISSCFYKQ